MASQHEDYPEYLAFSKDHLYTTVVQPAFEPYLYQFRTQLLQRIPELSAHSFTAKMTEVHLVESTREIKLEIYCSQAHLFTAVFKIIPKYNEKTETTLELNSFYGNKCYSFNKKEFVQHPLIFANFEDIPEYKRNPTINSLSFKIDKVKESWIQVTNLIRTFNCVVSKEEFGKQTAALLVF